LCPYAKGPRLIVPHIAVHIVQRGHDHGNCFRHDTDYLVYLANLRDLSARTRCALHAYCLMTNHVHLLLTPSNPHACALLMRNLGQRYVQYFNRRYERSGTLWEGRFRRVSWIPRNTSPPVTGTSSSIRCVQEWCRRLRRIAGRATTGTPAERPTSS